MPSDVCAAIKVSMAEVDRRLDDAPTAAEQLELGAQRTGLMDLWNLNDCGEGIDWAGLAIDPPTDTEIARVEELMEEAGEMTVDAMGSDAFVGAVITVVNNVGGITSSG